LGFYNAIKLFCYSFTRIVKRLEPQIPASASPEAIAAAKQAIKAYRAHAEKYRTMMLSNQEKLFPYMMRDCVEHGFYETLDKKADECNFANCIINFKTKEIRCRAPTDNCTLCTYSNYVQTGSPEDTEEFAKSKDEVMDLFTKIVPGEEERQWLMHTLAARFIGENKDHKIGFGKGPASNGKSILISLCRLIFGTYQRILPKEVLMGKGNKAGGAQPELALLRGVRLVFAPEPALTDVLNESLSKTLSGDDEIQVRALYCAPFQMKIQFMLWFMSNHFIRIPADGDGIWR
jgi:phage/plasmid-associated DNA primase